MSRYQTLVRWLRLLMLLPLPNISWKAKPKALRCFRSKWLLWQRWFQTYCYLRNALQPIPLVLRTVLAATAASQATYSLRLWQRTKKKGRRWGLSQRLLRNSRKRNCLWHLRSSWGRAETARMERSAYMVLINRAHRIKLLIPDLPAKEKLEYPILSSSLPHPNVHSLASLATWDQVLVTTRRPFRIRATLWRTHSRASRTSLQRTLRPC